MPPLLSITERVGRVRNPNISKSLETLRTISSLGLVFLIATFTGKGKIYRADYRNHLDCVSFDRVIVRVKALTMEAEHNAQLLEARRSEHSGWQGNLVLGQVLHDILDTIHVLGELLVVCLISLLDLLCFCVNITNKSLQVIRGAHHRSSHRQDPVRW